MENAPLESVVTVVRMAPSTSIVIIAPSIGILGLVSPSTKIPERFQVSPLVATPPSSTTRFVISALCLMTILVFDSPPK